ncbi:hypothetical protein B0H63DRAFT_462959 [Podospora didyma]|uniref:DNA damage-responsive protein 48 n=1 Tax=Podospora didyma TaxID=330526 RepID=A0AAE0P8I3_9PEZI|nr:hypothetical protein B0H63DRAFT_462959 [Podospora didyma]
MDFVNKLSGGGDNNTENVSGQQQESSSGGGLMGKLNSMAGGGKESEKNEDYLDKGVDAVQQYGFKQGDQSNESAVEQAKDEQISDYIRKGYKSATGNDVPVQDKS